MESTQSAHGTEVCAGVLVRLLGEQHGHGSSGSSGAAARLSAPPSPPPHGRGRARPARPGAASALPAGRAARQPPPHGEGKQTRLSGGLEPTVPGPGAGFLPQRAVEATPFGPVRLAAALAEEEQGALPSACGCRCLPGGTGRAARSLRETKGRGRAGKRRETP